MVVVLHRHPDIFRHPDVEELGVIAGPARGWDLDHANVLEFVLAGIEVRVNPLRREDGSADVIGAAGAVQVDGAAHRGLAEWSPCICLGS